MQEELRTARFKFIPPTSVASGVSIEVLPDLYCHTIQIVNICLVGNPDKKEFVLVDAGMPKTADDIIDVTEKRFAQQRRRIILRTAIDTSAIMTVKH